MAAVFGSSHGWRVRKFLRHPHPLSVLDPLGAFFGYFLCTSKESNSPSGESSAPRASSTSSHPSEALGGENFMPTVRNPAANDDGSSYPKPMTTDPIDLALIGGTGI